ncbi:hypothetical protein V1478_000414 [Vespula squamosa]|uniref:Uncharacterized protein n=1 Tax=Vespula squamosa TaxID=30214 RepID=A0ABD2C5F7_VESSQ
MRMGTTVQQNEIVSSQTISSKTRSVEIITNFNNCNFIVQLSTEIKGDNAYKEIYILVFICAYSFFKI